MDLETENRLAALLMEEARRLRLQAEKEGVHVYLRQPNVRGRPNSRFLTATVLGVQQANRAAEEGEMWRARDKELELDSRLNNRSKHRSKVEADKHHSEPVESHSVSSVPCSTSKRSHEDKTSSSQCLSSKRAHEDSDASENGMGDEDIERFLHSRVKRGRGAVGSRMDEPGPYLSASVNDGKQQATSSDTREREDWERRILGPEKPSFLQTKEQLLMDANHSRNVENGASSGTKKHHSKKHSTRKEKSEKMKRKEKQSKDKQKSRSTR